VIVAVDGGNSKTDLALVADDGALLALVRGPLSSPHHLGVEGALGVLESLLEQASRQARVEPPAQVAGLYLAGVDFPSEEQAFRELVETRGWARKTLVGNDTHAALRSGTDAGWGVAVVCGAGINCAGVAPDGREARFPSLGDISGDWGGGLDVGAAAIWAAARSEDGRGPKTSLERSVPAHFGVETPYELAQEIHAGRIPYRRAIELAPLVLRSADGDPVAAEIVHRLAEEVVTMARVALERLGLTGEPAEVVLGGGLFRSGNGHLLGAIEAGLRDVSPTISAHPPAAPPIAGAALLALDELGASPEALDRARRELQEAARDHG
jgi:N-acetylglucosamine kinase-like BadF-type ATPase